VLLKSPLDVAELVPRLKGFKIAGKRDAGASWHVAGPSLLLEYRPEVNGCLQIDMVDRPWPDSMGGLNEDPTLFAAWADGHFGPFCFPGSLERARLHCYTWKEGAEVAAQHKAFLRVRITYTTGTDTGSPVIPKGTRPNEETEQMLAVVEALLEHPAALCYFNPNGEVLAPLQPLAEICDHFRQASIPAVNLLANRRMIKFDGTDWMMMDLVGLGQLDQEDLEVCFSSRYDPNEVAVFLVNTALYMIKSGLPIKDGHTLSGPGNVRFAAQTFDEPKMVPPREVLRLRPSDGTVSPSELGFGDKPFGRRGWWQFWKL
jgi:hypothetical protein